MSETNSKHIISLIENQPLTNLTEADLADVRAHNEVCSSCKRAFTAAQISMLLLREGAPEMFAPPPFFQTRVLAALRERQAANEPWAWAKLWKATGALASSMAATVAMLAVLTFVLPGTQTGSDSAQLNSASGAYSAEEVILNVNDPNANAMDAQPSDGQVLNTLYEAADNTEK